MKEERYMQILEILKKNKFAETSYLAKTLYVSCPTIRRDLHEMEKQGLIVRYRRGAGYLPDGCENIPVSFRNIINKTEKDALCRLAATLVFEGCVVFVDCSTTFSNLPKYLKKYKNITIVTNSPVQALGFVKNSIRTFLAGGEPDAVTLSITDSFALDYISGFNFDFAFFSCHGIDKDGIICDTSPGENLIRKKVMEKSKKCVLVADKDKFSVSAPYVLTSVKNTDYFITNQKPAFKTGKSKLLLAQNDNTDAKHE